MNAYDPPGPYVARFEDTSYTSWSICHTIATGSVNDYSDTSDRSSIYALRCRRQNALLCHRTLLTESQKTTSALSCVTSGIRISTQSNGSNTTLGMTHWPKSFELPVFSLIVPQIISGDEVTCKHDTCYHENQEFDQPP